MGHTRRAMRQFTFLQQECAPVFGAASKAELAVYADPRTACFYARRSPGRAVKPRSKLHRHSGESRNPVWATD
jgi:hypothetical protein